MWVFVQFLFEFFRTHSVKGMRADSEHLVTMGTDADFVSNHDFCVEANET